MRTSIPGQNIDGEESPPDASPVSDDRSQPTNGIQVRTSLTGPTLSIDGTCRLCRASGAIACRLAPHISVLDGRGSTTQAPGVVLNFEGSEFVGIDAVVAWLRLAGGIGKRASSLLASRPIKAVASRCYRWVARHRHFLG
ncbi:hypothetical protein [Ferrimicrobium acidiphilum]|uniref:hypothetical protein n=1 Tax=Ferrimicrobium acidiphilum TaxID=121039 RepID=UPI0023F4A21A|nr:hypothetical protein [Ferrimicrobium acidiphilum]